MTPLPPPADYGSALDNLGGHLLGHRVSPPDARDHQVRDHLQRGDVVSVLPGRQMEHSLRDPDEAREVVERALADGAVDLAALWDEVEHQHHTPAFKAWGDAITHGLASLLPQPAPAPAPGPAPAPQPNPAPPTPTQAKRWENTDLRDQGQTGHCTGFGGIDHLNTLGSDGIDLHFSDQDGHNLYYYIKANVDGEPLNEDGSSGRSVMKALRLLGHINEYAAAADVVEIEAYLLGYGPVGIGIGWTQSMFTPDASGVIVPQGADVGGHYLVDVGVDLATGYHVLCNSWGDWGPLHGFALMHRDDLHGRIVNDAGEAWCALEIADPNNAPSGQ